MESAERSESFVERYYNWILFGVIVIGILFRWWDSASRPLHHDESIHVMFGRYFFDHPDHNYYKYNPEYHGPLLYNLLRFVYDVFGDTERTARGLIAVMGTAYLFMPILFRRYLSAGAVLGLTTFLALSPTLVYWSQFVREDFFVITGMLMMLIGVTVAKERHRALWVLLGVVFQWASKENSYVTAALIWAYLCFEYAYRLAALKTREPFPLTLLSPLPFAAVILLQVGIEKRGTALHVVSETPMHVAAAIGALLILVDIFRPNFQVTNGSLVGRLFTHIQRNRQPFFIALLIAGVFFCYLFSAGFRYPKGILDGLYRSGITYWLEKHQIERIKGPFLFHFYQLTWYEFAFMAVVLVHAFHLYRRSALAFKVILGATLLVGLATMVANWDINEGNLTFALWKALKIKDHFDVFGAFVLIVHPALVVCEHLRRKQWTLAFWAYWFLGSFFTYSYLGEKVPWLSIYPHFAGLIYLALYFDNAYREGDLSWMKSRWSISDIATALGTVLIGVSLVIIAEEFFRFTDLRPGEGNAQFRKIIQENATLLGSGLLLVLIGYLDQKSETLGRVYAPTVLFATASIFMFRMAVLTNFERERREFGYISQVHTTNEIVRVAQRIRSELVSKDGLTDKSVLVTGDAVWPLTWYFRDLPGYKFSATDAQKGDFNYIFQNNEESVPPGFQQRTVNLRGWWVPEMQKMTLKRFLGMSFALKVWGGPGFSTVAFLTKKEA